MIGLPCFFSFYSKQNRDKLTSTTDWLTLALVIITAFYAWATFKILQANQGVVQAMEAQTEAQLRPYVVARVTAQPGTTLLLLQIENTGKSPALDLRLHMDKEFFLMVTYRKKTSRNYRCSRSQLNPYRQGLEFPLFLG